MAIALGLDPPIVCIDDADPQCISARIQVVDRMIPLQLTLKNFLSYREATLDFRGLHVACVCGANGAGKSSLLEAIAWAIWGQSRAATDDDIIHLGETEALVDFIFQCHDHTYRVIRTRARGQTGSLEFQVQTAKGFRSLTERSMRATQQLILHYLRLDYDTFINSAYLRQGHADEFMLKRPSERKQILGNLLKLDQYDDLAEQAKERSRQLKAEVEVLERTLATMEQHLQQDARLAEDYEQLTTTLQALQQQQAIDGDTLRQLQATQQQRKADLQQLNLHQQQQQILTQDCQRLRQEHQVAKHQQYAFEAVLRDAEPISAGYAQFHSLQTEEETLSAKFHAHQAAQTQRQELLHQQAEAIAALKDQRNKLQAQLETLHQQDRELEQSLSKADNLEAALTQLQQARARLTELDQLQTQASPLLQRRHQLQLECDRAQTRLLARLDELQTAAQALQTQQTRQPQLQQDVLDVAAAIAYLEQRQTYQQQVREKGVERRNFMERLQERQRDYETQLAELDHKITLLRRDIAPAPTPDDATAEVVSPHSCHTNQRESLERLVQPTILHSPLLRDTSGSAFPPCPLCDRPLDEQHWTLVLDQYLTEQQELLRQIWVIREQLAVSEREIQVLRQEYRDLDKELSHYRAMLERRGQLQEQLQGASENQTRLQQLLHEQTALERSLQTGDYAPELHDELHLLEQTLQQLNYDDKNHALARGEVDRWRWAEIKHAELKQAQKRRAQIAERIPEVARHIAEIDHQIEAIATSPLQQQINQLDDHLRAIAYDLDRHTAVRRALRQAQSWQLRWRELQHAQQQFPPLQQRIREMADLLDERTNALQTVTAQVETLVQQLEQTPDASDAIATLEHTIQDRRAQLDEHLAQIGRLQQQQQQLDALKAQQTDLKTQQETLRRQLRIYQELAQAFGKNGIQALMIENVLPQLEVETNQILGRLSNHQLHVQFVTQRNRRSASRATAKPIDTLDIFIADAQGTRPYETYSGGEAFRINFAIRLALARLLAQRSGMALQLLIVDEGFGTQDEAGCDRLIAAIQAIAPDFSCILTVTHMPRLKEAFQTHIEVVKTQDGSQLAVSG